MTFFIRIIALYLCTGAFSLLFATRGEIFDIGQGNSFGIEHDGPNGKRVLIVDAGSSEYSHAAFYNSHATSRNPVPFPVTLKNPQHSEGGPSSNIPTIVDVTNPFSQEEDTADAHMGGDGDISPPLSSSDDGSSSSHGFLPLGQEQESPRRAGSSDEHLGKTVTLIAEDHRESVFERMIDFIWGNDSRPITRVDFVGTHSDDDHVNHTYLRTLFLNPLLIKIWGIESSENIKKASIKTLKEEVDRLEAQEIQVIKEERNIIRNIILGGFKDEYNQKIHLILKILRKLGTRVIFTGSYDGKGNRPKGERRFGTKWQEDAFGYARAYSSFMPVDQRSPIEKEIEEILNFGNGLETQILAMNAGLSEVSTIGNITRITNPDPNVNSMVLRFKLTNGGRSFVAPADAEESTWSFIYSMHQLYNPDENLETDYMLVSHHGSSTQGATSKEVLDLFNPKALLLSAGGHTGYNHPSYETITTLKKYLEKKKFETLKHDITYFKRRSPKSSLYDYHRLTTPLPIFSTTTGGSLSFTLDPSSNPREQQALAEVTTDRHKTRTFETEEKEKFIAKDFVVFPSKSDMNIWLRDYIKETESGHQVRIILWKDENKHSNSGGTRSGRKKGDSPVKQSIRLLDDIEKQAILSQTETSAEAEGMIVVDSGDTISASSKFYPPQEETSSGGSSSSKIENLVIREKPRPNTSSQWLVYAVNSVVEDQDKEMAEMEEKRETPVDDEDDL